MSNSLTQLNQYANTSVVFQDDRDYSITFSANAAVSTSTTIDEDDAFVVPLGIDITSVISQPGNIVYTVSGSTANIVASWPNPLPQGISNTSPGNGVFSITGTFDGTTWDQAKQLVMIAPDRETDFEFVGNIQYPDPANVSLTDSWSWTNAVTVANTNPDLFLTTSYTWLEDVPTPFVYEVQDLDPTATYTLTFDQITGTAGIITVNGVSAGIGNTATITGNRAAVNTANVVIFNPFPDAVDNVQVHISAVKSNPFGNVTFANNVVASLNNTGSHEEFSLDTGYSYTEDQSFDLVFEVLDTDAAATNYTVSFDQITGNTGVFFVDGVNQGIGNAAVVTDSKVNINAANISFLPAADDVGVVDLVYSQSKNTALFGNTVQAANVAILVTNLFSHEDFSLTTAYDYAEDPATTVDMVFEVLDTDTRATSYTVSFDQITGNTGVFFVDGVNQGIGNAAILANSKANINAANVSFLPAADDTGVVGIVYSQSKVNSVFGNVAQGSSNIALTNISSHTENSLQSATTYDENTRLPVTITDTDPRATSYTMTLLQTQGNTGTFLQGNTVLGQANVPVSFSNTRVNINNSNISWQPAVNSTGNVTLQVSQSKINTVFGNVAQLSNSAVALTVANTTPEIDNMIDRTVLANAVTNIFATSTPSINDGPDYGQSYTITLSSPVGRFGDNADQAVAGNTYSASGNLAVINSAFANIVFVPGYEASSGTFDYTQSRDGVSQVNVTKDLTVTPNSITPEIYTFTANSTFTPTFDQVYFGNTTILTVGGGGAGGGNTSTTPFNNKPGGGGGGGGAVGEFVINQTTTNALIQTTYNIVVGQGGKTHQANGQPSLLTLNDTELFKVLGGQGGLVDADNLSPWISHGGNSFQANGTVILGGLSAEAVSDSVKMGGGGAGAGQAGANAFIGTDINALGATAGNGGNGIQSSVSGNAVTYGGGGGGGTGFGAIGYPNAPPGFGSGGTGGGGSGTRTFLSAAGAGTDGLGGGGGGGTNSTSIFGVGGNGVVIINIS